MNEEGDQDNPDGGAPDAGTTSPTDGSAVAGIPADSSPDGGTSEGGTSSADAGAPENALSNDEAKAEMARGGQNSNALESQPSVELWLGYTYAVTKHLNEYHTFVVATDMETGEHIFTRAGPSAKGAGPSSQASGSSSAGGSSSASSSNYGGSGGYGFGSIYAQVGIWGENSPYDKPSKTVHIQKLGTTSSTLDEMQAMMKQFQEFMNAQQIPYWPFSSNSNSYAFSFLISLGISRPTPWGSAPAWDTNLGTNYFNEPILFQAY